MKELQNLKQDDRPVRTVEFDDSVQHVVDLGPSQSDAAVDVVDDTVIVILDDEQFDISVPERDAEAFIKNGVLTIVTEDSE